MSRVALTIPILILIILFARILEIYVLESLGLLSILLLILMCALLIALIIMFFGVLSMRVGLLRLRNC